MRAVIHRTDTPGRPLRRLTVNEINEMHNLCKRLNQLAGFDLYEVEMYPDSERAKDSSKLKKIILEVLGGNQ